MKRIVGLIMGVLLMVSLTSTFSLALENENESVEPVTLQLSVNVSEMGKTLSKKYCYTISLIDAKSGKNIESIKTTDGKVAFSNVIISEEGEYNYKIIEKVGSKKTVSYDDTVYLISVKATINNGTLKLDKTITKDGDEYKGKISFDNYIEAENEVTYLKVTIKWNGKFNAKKPKRIEVGSFNKEDMMYSLSLSNDNKWTGELGYYENIKDWNVEPTNLPNNIEYKITHTGKNWVISLKEKAKKTENKPDSNKEKKDNDAVRPNNTVKTNKTSTNVIDYKDTSVSSDSDNSWKSPDTGDKTNIFLYIGSLICSAVLLLFCRRWLT